ncbi:type II and III secretion system protein family protein [Vibrio sp. JC009]|uniref:type II and III secretion system protein family protein n=1 Tax=Vibrio sp. JC009 TaxID=2912314 RepID=UPI0023B0EB38|nr:type II and III secretion system protein family protein [Vibrio sp. JC009]WED21276.1 type II and III secretion system protein family protein [Vibrio sp. JC009]
MNRILTLIFGLLVYFWAATASASSAQTGETINVPHHKSTHIYLSSRASRVSLGDPEVLDIVMLKSDELFLIGKKLGSTNLMVWDKNGLLIEALNIEVTHDLNNLKSKLYEFLPDEKISVHSSKNKLILSGLVASQEKMNLALKVAETYSGGASADTAGADQVNTSSIINLMTIGGAQQVMLEVTVAEVERSLTKRFDANINFLQFSGSEITWGGGTMGGAIEPTALDPSKGVFTNPSYSDSGLLGSFLDGNTLFEFALDIAKETGAAKVLAEPNLTALSGAKAEFLAGGEYPIPVPDDDGITIEYREYGVGLEFVPTVLSDKKINLTMAVSVSELSSTSAVSLNVGASSSFYIPSTTVRSASSTLELADGQTIAIAGLLNESTREAVEKLPGLGDIPILGQLFNSQEFVNEETELVILVTPRLAKAIDRNKITLPTDGFVSPSDWEFYLLGKSSVINQPVKSTMKEQQAVEPVPTEKGGSEGKFGHSL